MRLIGFVDGLLEASRTGIDAHDDGLGRGAADLVLKIGPAFIAYRVDFHGSFLVRKT